MNYEGRERKIQKKNRDLNNIRRRSNMQLISLRRKRDKKGSRSKSEKVIAMNTQELIK